MRAILLMFRLSVPGWAGGVFLAGKINSGRSVFSGEFSPYRRLVPEKQ